MAGRYTRPERMPNNLDLQGLMVAVISHSLNEPDQKDAALANARLIAAAPDLLHALSIALPFVEDAEDDQCLKNGTVAKAIRIIKDALAKAEA